MPNNNPAGTNSWQGFGTEVPYGQATQDKAFAAAAPLAGARLASGPITAPERAKRQTQKPAPPPVLVAPPAPPHVDAWQQIAATPGASPLALEYAAKASQ